RHHVAPLLSPPVRRRSKFLVDEFIVERAQRLLSKCGVATRRRQGQAVMRKLLLSLLLLAPVATQANLAKCLLSELPGTANDVAAGVIIRICMQKYPEGLESVKQGSGRGWFGFESSAQCVAKH